MKATSFFVVQAVRRIVSGHLVGKLRVATFKNKGIDHQDKETWAIFDWAI